MQCSSPVFIQDKSTGGIMHVPCGRCMGCRLARAKMWSVRIMHEVKEWPVSSFITLTYNEEHLPKNLSLVKTDVQLFFKRLRKNLNKNIKYFLGGEYGELCKRPHYHAVVFGVGPGDRETIERSWGKGFVYIGTVTHDSARYVASYTLKKLNGDAALSYLRRGVIPEFALMSRNPGIGARFLAKHTPFLKQNGFCVVKGNKVSLPRYYSDKIFTDEDKARFHTLRQDFYDERFLEIKKRAGAIHDYQVVDYEKGMRKQLAADHKSRESLKKRKL